MENVSNDKLSEKMCVVPTVERWVKEVKGLTKERLEKGLKVPEFKLRKSGNITTLNAKGASGILFEANFPMGDFLECCTLKEAELVKKWAKYTDQKAAPAKRDLRLRLEAHITQRPKAQSVTREG